jgi:hypothetical protein
MANTTYIVLRQPPGTGGPDIWEDYAAVDASSATDAIKKVADDGGKYVAVPARSWKPVTVTTETRTILKLEQPDPAA